MDNKGELGKWIAGEGMKYSKSPEYATLRSEHTHFHKAAAELVRRVDTGQNISEELAVGAKGEFMTASRAAVTAIVKMRKKT